MKKLLFSLILLLVSYVGFSQKGLSYQAVILDPTKIEVPGQDISGQPLVNGDVWMKFSIYNGSTMQFEEVHKTKTDGYGLVNLLIGSVSSASFNSLVWDSSQKTLQVYVSFDQGGSYTKVSDQKLNYNPYALFAETAGKLGSVLPISGGGTGATTAVDARANLGLDQLNNTSDAAKPVSTATKAALDLKANAADVTAALALKANTADVATSLALKANSNDMTAALAAKADTGTIKTFVVTQVAAANIPDADATTKGKIQLAGDLAGTADAPTVPGLTLKANTADVTTALALKANTTDVTAALALKANTTSLTRVATTGSYTDLSNKPTIPSAYTLPLASASVLGGIKVGANLSIDANGVLSAAGGSSASSISGVVPIANGGTGTTTVVGIRYALGFSDSKVAIGDQAGQTNQGGSTVGVGGGAGATNQGSGSVAIGYVAGYQNQGAASIAIGSNAAQSGQGTQAVALGYAAGQNGQGAYSVAVGSFAGNSQAANSIALNATGASLNPSTTGFFVDPIRNASASNYLFYNTANKEISYGTAAFVDFTTNQTIGGTKTFTKDVNINGLTFGKGAGSNNGVSTAVGASALASNTTGVYNSAYGFQALFNNTTGSYNHALGFQVLAANTTGDRNNAFGQGALPSNTTGSDNVAIGTSAMYRNTTANDNIAIGTQALGNSLTGSNNIAIGSQTLTGNSTGSNNTAVGYQSLQQTSGSDNTALGRFSLKANTTGSSNTAIGSLADVNSNNLSNTTAIGFGARVSADNTIQLGADGSSFITNGVYTYTTAISNVRTSGTLTLKEVTYPNTNGTAGQVLTANNNGNASWTTISSGGGDASTLTGTLAITNGGTGATTASAALTSLGAAPIVSPVFTGSVTSPIYASTPQTLTDGSTITWNPALGLNANVTLGGNRTLNFSGSLIAGSYGTLVVTQDATGGRTITLPSTANKVLGSTSTTTITLSSAANAKDILNFYYDGANCYWNIGQGYGSASASLTASNIAGGAAGSIPYQTASGATSLLAKGTDGQVLTLASGVPSWAAPSGGSSSGGHYVGEVYGGGIVFYVTNGGYHGLIASSTDIVAIPMVIFDRATSPSYKFASNSENLYTDWVTPTFSQLNLLYSARTTTGLNLGPYFYISSTFGDNDAFSFKGLNFNTNVSGTVNGNWTSGSAEIRGRAIRTF